MTLPGSEEVEIRRNVRFLTIKELSNNFVFAHKESYGFSFVLTNGMLMDLPSFLLV